MTHEPLQADVYHLPFSDMDMHGLDMILHEWAKKGFEGEVETRNAQAGCISITTRNWTKNGCPFVTMELHKLRGKRGFFGQKSKWIVRLYSCESLSGLYAQMHGCVEGRNMLHAFDLAMVDVGYGFRSASRLEQYFEMP